MPDTAPDPLAGLTGKQSAFILAYIGEARCNATKAAKIAGYGGNDVTLAVTGYDLLRNPKIKKIVREMLSERIPGAEEILAVLTRQLSADGSAIEECYDEEETPQGYRKVLNWTKVREKGLGPLIRKVTPTKHGDMVELYDAQRAAELLGKYRALFTEKIKVEGDLDMSKLSPEQLAALAAGKRPDDV